MSAQAEWGSGGLCSNSRVNHLKKSPLKDSVVTVLQNVTAVQYARGQDERENRLKISQGVRPWGERIQALLLREKATWIRWLSLPDDSPWAYAINPAPIPFLKTEMGAGRRSVVWWNRL